MNVNPSQANQTARESAEPGQCSQEVDDSASRHGHPVTAAWTVVTVTRPDRCHPGPGGQDRAVQRFSQWQCGHCGIGGQGPVGGNLEPEPAAAVVPGSESGSVVE